MIRPSEEGRCCLKFSRLSVSWEFSCNRRDVSVHENVSVSIDLRVIRVFFAAFFKEIEYF